MEWELPKRSALCMECGVSFKKKAQGATFLKVHMHSIRRVDVCEACALKKKGEADSRSALWQWTRKKEEMPERVSFQELVTLLFSLESGLTDQEKFVLAHVLKRGKVIRQRSKTKEGFVVETLDKTKKLHLTLPIAEFPEEVFLTVHNLFQSALS